MSAPFDGTTPCERFAPDTDSSIPFQTIRIAAALAEDLFT